MFDERAGARNQRVLAQRHSIPHQLSQLVRCWDACSVAGRTFAAGQQLADYKPYAACRKCLDPASATSWAAARQDKASLLRHWFDACPSLARHAAVQLLARRAVGGGDATPACSSSGGMGARSE